MESKLDKQVVRMDVLEKRSEGNKQGIMVIFECMQQIVNVMLEKKNKQQQLQKLIHQIDEIKNEFIDKCKVYYPDQALNTTPTTSHSIKELRAASVTTASNNGTITRAEEDHPMELTGD